MIRYTGPMRLYFIAPEAFPLVWCISTDDWELAVKSIEIRCDAVASRYEEREPVEHEYAKPCAWFEVSGELSIRDGHAMISEPDGFVRAPTRFRCECDHGGVGHESGGCKLTAYRTVERDGKRVTVCHRCDLSGDVSMGFLEGA